MARDDEFFTPETVDEQIEQLARAPRALPPGRAQAAGRQLVQNLHRLYEIDKADERSKEAVWERLARQTAFVGARRRGHSGSPSGRLSPQAGQRPPSDLVSAARARRGWSSRLAALVAAAVLVVVVGSLVAGLVLVGQHNHQTAAHPTPTPTLLDQQRVYVATSSGLITAFNAATGAVRWTHQSLGALLNFASNGADVPAMVLSQGALYIASHVGIEAVRTSDGSLLWQQKIGLSFSVPVVSNGVVYVSTETLYAFNATNGRLLWSQKEASSYYAVLAATEGTLYVQDAASSAVEAFRATNGTFLWKVDETKPYWGAFQGAAFGVVYLTSNSPDSSFTGPNLFALNASDGSLLWQGANDHEPTILGIGENVVYVQIEVSFADQRIYALNASDGSVRWQLQGPDASSPITSLIDNVVYVDTADGAIHAFSASDGSKLWVSSAIQKQGYATVAGVSQGFVYADDGASPTPQLYALHLSDGTLQWKKALAPGIVGGLGDLVYTMDQAGLYAFNSKDGSVRWSYSQYGLEMPALVDSPS